MKQSLLLGMFIIAAGLLSACASNGTNPNVSTIGMESRPTGRLPSPGNVQGTNLNNSSRMIAPAY
jgi:hypothetical protein